MSEVILRRLVRPRQCAVRSCKNNSAKKEGYSFFAFPDDYNRALEWITNCQRPDLLRRDLSIYRQHTYVCGKHFEGIMFRNDLKNRLHPHAIPTLFLNPTQIEATQFNVNYADTKPGSTSSSDQYRTAIIYKKKSAVQAIKKCKTETVAINSISSNDNDNIVIKEENIGEDSEELLEDACIPDLVKVEPTFFTKYDSYSNCNVVSSSETQSAEMCNVDNIVKVENSSTLPTNPVISMSEAMSIASDVDTFCTDIANTIKRFPPYQQHLAKTKILNIVSEIELDLYNVIKEEPK